MSGLPRRRLLAAGAGAVLLTGCKSVVPRPAGPLTESPALLAQWQATHTEPLREARAVWVATVANIDWPSRKGLDAAALQAETLGLLDHAAALGLNTVLLQVRPSCDAIYPSALEPWTEYLSGVQGQAPAGIAADAASGGYDPLAFWIEQAHARGLALQAWINPYRARASVARSPLAASHIAQRRPDLTKPYGDQLWLDPAEPDAVAHTLAVCRDLLTRYPLDGLHLDDYFYPYPVQDAQTRQELDFPDEAAWQREQAARAGAVGPGRADWRREQVNQLVQQLQILVRSLRPGARFGISPFGLPRPDLRPAGISGFSQFDKLYADVERWLAEGWVDELLPQLYWPRAQKAQAFEPLLQTWQQLNPRGRHVWPGLFSSRITDRDDSWPIDEIVGQVQLSRAHQSGGHAHFSMVALAQNRRGLADALRPLYQTPALPPTCPWLADGAASPSTPEPVLQATAGGWTLGLPADGPERALLWHCDTDQPVPVWQWQLLWRGGPPCAMPAGSRGVLLQALDTAGQALPTTRAWTLKWPADR